MKRWLVIDDDMDYQKIIGLILSRFGIEIDRTADPIEAIEKIKKNGYERILIDQRMPVMSGISLVKTVKNFIHCPVHIISAYRESDMKNEQRESGVFIDSFINKDHLSESIKELVDAT